MKPSVSFAALSFGALASAGFVPADRRSPLASPSFSSLIRHSGRGPPTPAFPTPHNTPSRLFNLTAEGPTCANGPIRQIENGQNRIGGDDGVGTYLLKDGKIFDMSRRGCTLTPPTNQWQCNEGVLPSPGFGISKDGLLTYLDRTTFWACPVNDFCVWNTYSEPIKNQLKCVEIKLRAQERGQSGGKSSELPKERPQTPSQPSPGPDGPVPWGKPAPPPSPIPTSRVGESSAARSQTANPREQPAPVDQPSYTSACPEKSTQTGRSSQAPCVAEQPTPVGQPSSTSACPEKSTQTGRSSEAPCVAEQPATTPQSPCPLDLEGKVVYPEPIIPVSEHLPHTALGAHSNGTIAPGVCSLYDFKIDAKQEGKKCTLMFLLPKQGPENERLFTFGHFDLSGRYELKGKGNLYFFWLEDFADEKTTWANKSKASPFEIGPQPIKPGSSIAVHTGDCPAGEKFTVQICGDGNLKLEYEQGTGEDSMGLFIRVC
ncbi:uncharacterized protein EI97DRAFT_384213 [Westerdykella ornata]|uniref:Uncharacterized protein n=1 Tax=Westerdykella ornata TaxID=318751 RepID=A0A6A6J978_WESOR|nr:uncharacterized protein EI97DRAFT_384213 [Westerdykella ornata]KAF2273131.1 hypothetical protein EI97DRAFT_384213 [Westerdykella ornata]